jgi:superfamily II DNA/RNA helicase
MTTRSPRPASPRSPRPVGSSQPTNRGGAIRRANRDSTGPAVLAKKVDLFASFDQGTPPNLEASFAELGVPERLVKELTRQGIDQPFPIQAATMADCLAGRDVLGRGRTGSGKTLAFVLPVLTRLASSTGQRRAGRPRALILVPTRELAVQIKTVMDPFAHILSLYTTTIFGGVGAQPQIKALRAGVDIVIACPGRLLDHIGSNVCALDAVEITVLDEADHMADMGFLPDVKRILDKTPQHSQRLLFSATLDNGIDALVNKYLNKPILRSVDPLEAVETKMTHHVLQVHADDKIPVLRDLAAAPGRIMVFTRTKHGAKKLTKTLVGMGVPSVEMHGNLSQNVRLRNLEMFRTGTASAMVATDVAARGIHVDDINLVVHFDPPVDHKAYLHRSGRTARAGAEGTVITLITSSQASEVRDLAKKAGISPTTTGVTVEHPLLVKIAPGERIYVTPPPPEAEAPVVASRPARVGRASRPAGGHTSAGSRPPRRTDGPGSGPAGGSDRAAAGSPRPAERGERADGGRPWAAGRDSQSPSRQGAPRQGSGGGSAAPASGRPAGGGRPSGGSSRPSGAGGAAGGGSGRPDSRGGWGGPSGNGGGSGTGAGASRGGPSRGGGAGRPGGSGSGRPARGR